MNNLNNKRIIFNLNNYPGENIFKYEVCMHSNNCCDTFR